MEQRSELCIDEDAGIPADVAEWAIAAAQTVLDQAGITVDDCAQALFVQEGLEHGQQYPGVDLDEMERLVGIWDEAADAADKVAAEAMPDDSRPSDILEFRLRPT